MLTHKISIAFAAVATSIPYCSLSIGQCSSSQVTVKRFEAGVVDPIETCHTAGTPITIPLSAITERVNVFSLDSVNIGRLTLSGGGAQTLELLIGGDGAPGHGDSEPLSFAGDFGGVVFTLPAQRDATTLRGAIDGDLTDQISVGRLSRFDVGGAVLDGIFADTTAGGIFVVECGSTGPNGAIDIDQAGITRVRVLSGDAEGDIYAGNGDIQLIEVLNGDLLGDIEVFSTNSFKGGIAELIVSPGGNIGSPTDTVSITWGNANQSAGATRNIEADAIWANLDTQDDLGIIGELWRLQTRIGDASGNWDIRRTTAQGALPDEDGIIVAGDLNATLDLDFDLRTKLDVAGDVNSDIVIGRYIWADEMPSARGKILIEGDLNADILVSETRIVGPDEFEGPIQIVGDVVSAARIDFLESMTEDLVVGGMLAGTLEIDKRLTSAIDGDLSNGDVLIGASMTGAISWLEDSGDVGSLNSQVLINTDGLTGSGGEPANSWSGSITIEDGESGTSTVFVLDDSSAQPDQAPYYTRLSSELGGGAVGLAPFNFHQRESAPPTGESRDCDPYQNETVSLGPLEDLNSVRIRHYGPVYVDGAGPHFRVEFKPRWLPSTWSDKTSLFEVDTSLSGTSPSRAITDVFIKPTAANKNGFKTAGFWRIRPLPGKVKCGDVTGNLDVYWSSSVVSGDLGSSMGTQYDWYAFDVLTFLALNSSVPVLDGNQVNASDLSSWPVEPFDTNADGETDTGDFADMADAYDE